MICKICGLKAESEFCFRHKKKKPLCANLKSRNNRLISIIAISPPKNANSKGVLDWKIMRGFFLEIWKKRHHNSEISRTSLGEEPLTIFFHHILSKNKYPQAQYDEENIILLTLEEHDTVEANMYKYEKINYIREKLLLKYNL